MTYKFDGNKLKFRKFQEEVYTNVMAECGRYGYKYLSEPWPINDTTGELQLDEEYNPVDIPRMPTERDKPGDRRDLLAMRKEAKEHNEAIKETISKCSKILTDRISSSINSKFLEFNGDPILFWHYLKSNYGKEAVDIQGIGREFIRFIGSEMPYTQRFNEFILDFERTADLIDLTEKNRLGLILSSVDDNTNNKICILPQRLWNAWDRCRLDKLDYSAAIKYLMDEDDNQHAAGLPAEPAKKVASINRGSEGKGTIVCDNCSNSGHMSRECRTDACGHCEKFKVGHKYHNCPIRRQGTSSVSLREHTRMKGGRGYKQWNKNHSAPGRGSRGNHQPENFSKVEYGNPPVERNAKKRQ